jgi:ribonucleotide reductase beta subunit family protein with ferritin-like domain
MRTSGASSIALSMLSLLHALSQQMLKEASHAASYSALCEEACRAVQQDGGNSSSLT